MDGDRDSPRKRSVPATPSTEGYVYEDAMEEDVVGMAGPDR